MLCWKLVDYLQAQAPGIYAQWASRTKLFSYFQWHALQGTLAVRHIDKQIIGVAIGWRAQSRTLRKPEFLAARRHHSQADRRGDAFYCDLLVATWPRVIASLVAEYQWRYPDWRRLGFFVVRRGRLREYRPERFLAGLEAMADGRWQNV